MFKIDDELQRIEKNFPWVCMCVCVRARVSVFYISID